MKFGLEGGVKKIGSNFRLSGQKLFLDFKNPYKIVAFAEPRLWQGEAVIAQNSNFEKWRRGWDSNPRVLKKEQRFSGPPRYDQTSVPLL